LTIFYGSLCIIIYRKLAQLIQDTVAECILQTHSTAYVQRIGISLSTSVCFTCIGRSFDEQSWKVDRRRHHSAKQYLCTPSTVFTTQETSPSHRKQQTEEQMYSCNQCGKCYSSQSNLHRHMNIHACKYKCTECGKCCQNSSILARHRRSHS